MRHLRICLCLRSHKYRPWFPKPGRLAVVWGLQSFVSPRAYQISTQPDLFWSISASEHRESPLFLPLYADQLAQDSDRDRAGSVAGRRGTTRSGRAPAFRRRSSSSTRPAASATCPPLRGRAGRRRCPCITARAWRASSRSGSRRRPGCTTRRPRAT